MENISTKQNNNCLRKDKECLKCKKMFSCQGSEEFPCLFLEERDENSGRKN